MTRNTNILPEDIERLSAYLDNELPEAERLALETELAENSMLQAELAGLQQTKNLLASLPELKAPRSYALHPDMLERSSEKVITFPTKKKRRNPNVLSAIAAVFVMLFGLGFILSLSNLRVATNTVLVANATVEGIQQANQDDSFASPMPKTTVPAAQAMQTTVSVAESMDDDAQPPPPAPPSSSDGVANAAAPPEPAQDSVDLANEEVDEQPEGSPEENVSEIDDTVSAPAAADEESASETLGLFEESSDEAFSESDVVEEESSGFLGFADDADTTAVDGEAQAVGGVTGSAIEEEAADIPDEAPIEAESAELEASVDEDMAELEDTEETERARDVDASTGSVDENTQSLDTEPDTNDTASISGTPVASDRVQNTSAEFVEEAVQEAALNPGNFALMLVMLVGVLASGYAFYRSMRTSD